MSRAVCHARLRERHVEADQQAVAGHAEDRAVVAVRGVGHDLEVLVQHGHHLVHLDRLGEARESAQVGEQRHHADALRGRLERRAVVLGDDPVGKLRRDVARERLVDGLLALHLGGEAPALELLARLVQAAQRIDPRDQLLAPHRLGEEIVGPGADAAHPAFMILERRHQHDRRQRGRRIALEALADLEAVHVRQHHVEQDEIGRARRHAGERARAVEDRFHAERLAPQQAGEKRRHVLVVVDDQDPERRLRRRLAHRHGKLTHR
jgi:hypothetical protein